MKFDRKQQYVAKVRARARKHGCRKCKRVIELGITGDESLNQMMRRGASIREIKTAIRTRGWYCRKCVRKSKGTTAAATLRDQYDMTDPEQEKAYHVRVWNMKPVGDAPFGYERIKPGSTPDCFK